MKNKIFGTMLVAVVLFLNVAHAGAEIVVNLNTGAEFKWQFMDMEEASEFLADRVESGRCSPKVVSVEIRSVYIEGLDNPKDKFAWYHGVEMAGY
jgi:hypothetical protein